MVHFLNAGFTRLYLSGTSATSSISPQGPGRRIYTEKFLDDDWIAILNGPKVQAHLNLVQEGPKKPDPLLRVSRGALNRKSRKVKEQTSEVDGLTIDLGRKCVQVYAEFHVSGVLVP